MSKQRNISLALAAATCALNGSPVIAAESKTTDIGEWDIKAALLFYNESDRVTAFEPVISATKKIDSDETISYKLALDALTGASANGAVPTDGVQTFTRPSGNGSYNISAGDLPLDDTFRDTRVAFSAAWEKPLSDTTKMQLGGNVSKEYDYLSISGNSLFSYDLNQRNTTLSAGLSLAYDVISPEGDIPTAFGAMQASGATQPRDGRSDSKILFDALFGWTQVIDKNSLFQVNYSIGQSNGYLTDPFKVLSVVDPTTGRPIDLNTGVSAISGATFIPQVVFENRPDSRTKHSLFGRYKRYLDGDVIDASYRFLTDDWGINSHTLELRYRWALSDDSYWQPHVRYYQQSRADFYQPYLIAGSTPSAGDKNTFASADYRLGDFNAYTVGIEYGRTDWSLAVEYYLQTADEPDNKVGELNNQELIPDLDAIMLRFNYDF